MANIFGQVKHTVTGKAIPGARVTASAKNFSALATTNDKGEYTLTNLTPGDYTVNVTATGYTATLVSPPGDIVTVGNVDVAHNLTMDALSISGRVTNQTGAPVIDAEVTATIGTSTQTQISTKVKTDSKGDYSFLNLADGTYTVSVPGYLAAHNVAVVQGATASGIDFSLDVVKDFLDRLDDARFSIESQISLEEANQAIALFSVTNLLLAGLSRRRVGVEEQIDVLAVLTLYYELQDGSLRNKITVADSQIFWSNIETELNALAKELDQLQRDVDFLTREAKRQFNLGITNSVLANVGFPSLFRRYVDVAIDPLLSLDIRKEEANPLFDKAKLAEADDLLKELKGLILQIVRSLSKYGTAATKRANEQWASFEARALEVLAIVAQNRVTPDLDDKNPFSLLAELINKNRETEVAPMVVLARNGGKLLQIAKEVYLKTQDQLDNFDRDHLRDLFQTQGEKFMTTRLREEATIVKRYPLTNWG